MIISEDALVRCIACSLIQPDECKAALSGRFSRLNAIRKACSDEDNGLNLKKTEKLTELMQDQLAYDEQNYAFLKSLNRWSTLSFWQWISLTWTYLKSYGKTDEEYYEIVAQKISGYMNEFFRDSIERLNQESKTLYSAPTDALFIGATNIFRPDLITLLFSHFELRNPSNFYEACRVSYNLTNNSTFETLIQNASADFLHFTLSEAIQYETTNNLWSPAFTTALAHAIKDRFQIEKIGSETRAKIRDVINTLSSDTSPVFTSPRYAETWTSILATLQSIRGLGRSEIPQA